MTRTSPADDPILQRFRAALRHEYGDRIERIMLHGSRARGDAAPDSDYDIAVFLRDLTDRHHEVERIADLQVRMMDETEIPFDVMPFEAGSWAERTPFMHELRREGLDL